MVAGTEVGGLGSRWRSWVVPAAACGLLGVGVFRFPRSLGVPVLVLGGVLTWVTLDALKGFSVLGPVAPDVRVQPLTDRETISAFALRVDLLEVPRWPVVPALYRLRPGATGDPAEWWWSWAESVGWGRSVGASLPDSPLKYGVYRLGLSEGNVRWTLVAPELSVPDPQ